MSVASDLAAILRGWDSHTVTVGAYQGRGVVDTMDVLDTDRAGDPVLVRRTVVKLAKADLLSSDGLTVGVARGDAVTIDGLAYVVADVRIGSADGRAGGEELDGREVHLLVRRV